MYSISVSPHLHNKYSIPKIMWNVIIALIPAMIASVYFFGMRAFWMEIVSILAAVLSEIFIKLLLKRKITIYDGSAVLTGLLVAYNMPIGAPFYVPIVGSIFAIIVVKELFGGLGNNIFNPALAGRVFVMFAWLPEMTTWNMPLKSGWWHHFNLFSTKIDTITAATPLAVAKLQGMSNLISQFGSKTSLYWNLFIGNVGGCVGETSALALIIGFLYLWKKRIVNIFIPLSYILTVFLLTLILGYDPVFHILAGGLMLGALFMATDYVTTPITPKGMIIFGIGAGLMTVLLRLKGGLPEGVSFSILMMNTLTPLIDRYTAKRKIYGYKK